MHADDPRLRPVLVHAHQPSFAEVQRIYKELTTVVIRTRQSQQQQLQPQLDDDDKDDNDDQDIDNDYDDDSDNQ